MCLYSIHPSIHPSHHVHCQSPIIKTTPSVTLSCLANMPRCFISSFVVVVQRRGDECEASAETRLISIFLVATTHIHMYIPPPPAVLLLSSLPLLKLEYGLLRHLLVKPGKLPRISNTSGTSIHLSPWRTCVQVKKNIKKSLLQAKYGNYDPLPKKSRTSMSTLRSSLFYTVLSRVKLYPRRDPVSYGSARTSTYPLHCLLFSLS